MQSLFLCWPWSSLQTYVLPAVSHVFCPYHPPDLGKPRTGSWPDPRVDVGSRSPSGEFLFPEESSSLYQRAPGCQGNSRASSSSAVSLLRLQADHCPLLFTPKPIISHLSADCSLGDLYSGSGDTWVNMTKPCPQNVPLAH